ncbi:MAG: hypothetical protein K2K24_02295, partial [Clostridia bacterium]|nr:hypothetical protein [Clostridia bacterium]
LKWQYTHGEVTATYDFDQNKWLDANGDEISPIEYDKTSHALTLVGKDDIANLQIDVIGYEYTDASDDYIAQITFAYDTVNYNAPDFPTTLSWSIAKATIDTSAIVWGYDDGDGVDKVYTEAFTYSLINGVPVEYTLKLINVPSELNGAITYLGTQTASNKSANNLEYVLSFNDSNYNPVEMPDELQKIIRWEIKQRLLAKPENDGSWTVFDDKEHNLADIFGVNEEGWENYFTISVTYNNEPFDGYVCKNAGRYNVSFILKNEDDVANVYWHEEPSPVNILNVEKLVIKIDGWTDRGANSTVILAEDEDEHKIDYLSYKYVDVDDNEVSLSSMKYNVEYYRVVCVKEGYESNVEIELGEECLDRFAFSRSDGKTLAHKPKFEKTELVYDGLTHTLSDFGISGVEEYMQVSVAQGNIKNAGEYKVTIALKYKDTYCWEDGTDDDFEVILTVNKYQLPTNWEVNGGKPKFVLPENLNDNVELEYAYFDEDGVEVAGKDLKAGVTYAVVAKLTDKYNQNYEFVDVEGQSLEISEKASFVASGAILSGEEQEPPKNGIDLSNILNAIKENWQPILAVVSLLFTVLFMAKGVGYAGKRKKVKKTIDKRYTAYYAISGVGLFNLPNTTWTMIACIMAGVAVLAFIFMLLQKRMYNKALEDMEDAKEEYTRNREESNFMRYANGGMGMGQAGIAYAQPMIGLGADDIRGIVADTMNNMLPNVTQYLPQEASYNDELIQQLIDQNAQNEERMRQMNEQNEERIRQLTEENEVRIRQLTAQNDELMRSLAQGQELL